MSTTEVTMSMSDVVLLKTDGDDPGNAESSRTQVILQLQPMPQGISEDSSETDAAVVSVETHTDDNSACGEEVELGYPITCGDIKAVLIWKKFVCPGINVKCVKYHEQLISPKQFVHLAGKATLKDWKRAIRLEGVMLRKMMDSGQIDFYQHNQVCTNTCRSTKFDLLINNTRFPGQQSSMAQTPTSPQGNGSQLTISEVNQDESVEWTQGIAVNSDPEGKKDTEEISEETLNFWKGIADVGLMGEVVSNIRNELLALLRGVQQRSGLSTLQEADAAFLNNLAQMFGLLETVKRVLYNRKSQTDESQEQIHSTLTDLENQLEEQKKQATEWRIRSQPVQNVVVMSLGTAKPTSKRPRLQRPASATLLTPSTSLQSSQVQQSTQFTVLSPITISSMGQPFSVGGVPVATLAHQSSPVTLHTLPSGSQFFTRYTAATMVPTSHGKAVSQETITLHPSSSLTLLSTAAIQDPSHLGAVVNPVELVEVDPGLASVVQAAEEDGLDDEGRVEDDVEGTVLVHDEGHIIAETEEETETQTQTVIEIDPAPDTSEQPQDTCIMGIELADGTDETDRMVVQEEEVEMSTASVQIEHPEQLHDVAIVVIEDDNGEEHEAKCASDQGHDYEQ
ncbi:glucocorticoid modulatory element-binding protein 1 [Polypterus senegalus]